MTVSKTICKDQLPKMFQVLQDPLIDEGIKLNIIMTLGDLFNKFPNELKPHTGEIFSILHQDSLIIKKETLTILSHLVLNDMILITLEIADIICLRKDCDPTTKDKDQHQQSINNQVDLFFNELNIKKDNLIYNQFVNVVVRLA